MSDTPDPMEIDVTPADSPETMSAMRHSESPIPFSDAQPELFSLMLITDTPGGPGKATFNIFHDIGADRYFRYLRALGRLQRAANGGLIIYARQSHSNLESVASQIRDHISKLPPAVQSASADSWYTNVACCVLTFCSALHLYYEQTLGEVKRAYGDSSGQFASTESIFSSAYDRSFAYRLLYRLRNILVHHSLGSIGFYISSKEETSASGLVLHKHTVRVPLKRDVFLSAEKAVNASVRREVEGLEDDPDLLRLCSEAMTVLEQIHHDISQLVRPSLHADARLVCELDLLFESRPGGRALVRVKDFPSAKPAEMPMSPIAPELFEYAREIVASIQ